MHTGSTSAAPTPLVPADQFHPSAPHAASRTTAPHPPCNRRCRHLYMPLPIWTIPRAIDADLALPMPPASGLAGTWSPGRAGTLAPRGPFACTYCWGVRTLDLFNHDGWNNFIKHITGGLLYGQEVPRPFDLVPAIRQRRASRRRTPRPAPRRDQIQALLIEGLSYREIATRMGLRYKTVAKSAWTIYKRHNARDRAELIEKCTADNDPVDAVGHASA